MGYGLVAPLAARCAAAGVAAAAVCQSPRRYGRPGEGGSRPLRRPILFCSLPAIPLSAIYGLCWRRKRTVKTSH
eukprot:scaffold107702_cov34-Tisochrysis_lutea.AAC.1